MLFNSRFRPISSLPRRRVLFFLSFVISLVFLDLSYRRNPSNLVPLSSPSQYVLNFTTLSNCFTSYLFALFSCVRTTSIKFLRVYVFAPGQLNLPTYFIILLSTITLHVTVTLEITIKLSLQWRSNFSSCVLLCNYTRDTVTGLHNLRLFLL